MKKELVGGTGKSDEEIARATGKRINRMVYDGGWDEERIVSAVLSALREQLKNISRLANKARFRSGLSAISANNSASVGKPK